MWRSHPIARRHLSGLFERQFSVDDTVRRYKPAREVYRDVEVFFDSPPARLLPYRLSYVGYSGSSGGWVEHGVHSPPRHAPLAVGAQPLIQGADLNVVAQELIQRFAA